MGRNEHVSDPTGRHSRPDRQGLPCPECGALRAADNTPSCACAQRASDALRDTRTAEAAAAEDFDPLRIRPYVEIGEGEGGAGGESGQGTPGGGTPSGMPGAPYGAPDAPSGAAAGFGTPPGAAEMTMSLRAIPTDETVPLRAVDATAALPTPLAPTGAEPSTTDLSLFEATDGDRYRTGGYAYADDEDAASPNGRRRRRTLLLATTGAVVAVVTAAGFASGLFSYEKPTRDSAAPEDVRAAVPDASTSAASASPSASDSPSPSASSASPSASTSESASPSATASSASPSASASAEPSQTAPTSEVTSSSGPDNGADGGGETIAAPVLRRGDKGAEVTELQLRLRQLYLYNGKANGNFTGELEDSLRNYQWARGIRADELGVYGAASRQSLESETAEP